MPDARSVPPVLMIGLDAAEPELIERWMGDGTLPTSRACAPAAARRLASSAAWLAGSPWPTFYTGTSPATHGLYHFLQRRAEQRDLARPEPGWLPLQPFWRALGPDGPRALVVHAPSSYPRRIAGRPAFALLSDQHGYVRVDL